LLLTGFITDIEPGSWNRFRILENCKEFFCNFSYFRYTSGPKLFDEFCGTPDPVFFRIKADRDQAAHKEGSPQGTETELRRTTVKKVLRSAVLTLICAGILSAATMPKNLKPVSTNASPIPMCDPGEDCSPFPK
jgi:hypothetical protein